MTFSWISLRIDPIRDIIDIIWQCRPAVITVTKHTLVKHTGNIKTTIPYKINYVEIS